MTRERWQHVKDTFHAALGRTSDERSSWLDEVCVGDDSLRREIESLIQAYEQTGKFVDAPAYEAAAALLAEGEGVAKRSLDAVWQSSFSRPN